MNGAYKGDNPIGKLMHDFSCPDQDKMYYEILAERTRKYKDIDEGGAHMGYIQEIREETKEAIALRLLQKGKATLEEIAEYTELTLEHIQDIRCQLEKNINVN